MAVSTEAAAADSTTTEAAVPSMEPTPEMAIIVELAKAATTVVKVPPAMEARAAVKSRSTVKAARSPVTSIPRTGTDKNAIYEPGRTVVTIRRARIGVIRIVAISTGWRWSVGRSCVGWDADSDADRKSLGVSIGRRNQKQPKHR